MSKVSSVPINSGLDAAQAAAQLARGSRTNNRVSVSHHKGILSEAQDTAEEISRDLGHKTREKKSASKTKQTVRVPRFVDEAQLKTMTENMPDLDVGTKVLELRQRILDSSFLTAKSILQEVKRDYEDPAHAFLILKELQKGVKSPSLLAVLQEAEAQLLENYEAEIQAGLNITKLAYEINPDQTSDLRKAYKEAVIEYNKLSKTYKDMLAKFGGGKRFEKACKFLLSAAACDLDSPKSSMPKEKLQIILDDLYALKALLTVHQHCEDFIKKVRRIYQAGNRTQVDDFMGEILPMVEGENTLIQDQLESVFSMMEFEENLQGQIFTLTYMLNLARDLPDKIFEDEYQRENAMSVIQDTLDYAVQREEEQ